MLVLNGPNLDILHRRDVSTYGGLSLADIERAVATLGDELGVGVRCVQSNHEGALIDALNQLDDDVTGVILNPGGYTHTSVAIADAISSMSSPVIEVHISNIMNRELFRSTSLISSKCQGTITGFGLAVYEMAIYSITIKKS